jgi:hypothetical protein
MGFAELLLLLPWSATAMGAGSGSALRRFMPGVLDINVNINIYILQSLFIWGLNMCLGEAVFLQDRNG